MFWTTQGGKKRKEKSRYCSAGTVPHQQGVLQTLWRP